MNRSVTGLDLLRRRRWRRGRRAFADGEVGQEAGDLLVAALAVAGLVDAAEGARARRLVLVAVAVDEILDVVGAVLLVAEQGALRLMVGELNDVNRVASKADLHPVQCSLSDMALTRGGVQGI